MRMLANVGTWVVLTTVLLGIVVFGGACSAEPTATPEPEMTVEELLDRTRAQLLSFQTVRFQMIDEFESGRKFFEQTLKKADGDIQSPDSVHLTVDVESPVLGFAQIVIIAVGDSAVIRFASDAPWIPLPIEQVPFNFAGLGMTLSDILPKIQNPEITGRESLDGVDTITFAGDLVSQDLRDLIPDVHDGHPIDLTVWVDAGDQRIQQMRIDGNLYDDDGAGTSRLVILSEYDEPVDVQLP